MAKFKISLKLTGLELNVEGNREDVPLMTQAVSQQFSGLLGPASDIIEGEVVEEGVKQLPAPGEKATKRPPQRRSHASPPSKADASSKVQAVDWRHDPSKWGTPKQDWVTADKSIWLLFVVANELQIKELTANQIAVTFNKHFRQAGQLQSFNVNRDLGKLKGKAPATVAEDTTKTPPAWFLTDAGEKRAHELLAKARGEA